MSFDPYNTQRKGTSATREAQDLHGITQDSRVSFPIVVSPVNATCSREIPCPHVTLINNYY